MQAVGLLENSFNLDVYFYLKTLSNKIRHSKWHDNNQKKKKVSTTHMIKTLQINTKNAKETES